jgi:tape measure domain-containing protein
MADDAASLVVQLRADQARFQREMSKIARDASKAADRVEKGFKSANDNAARSFGKIGTSATNAFRQAERGATSYSAKLDQISRKMDAMGGGRLGGGVGAAAGALVGGFSIQSAQALLDANTRITNALKVAGVEGENLTRVYGRLADMAKANGASFESLATLYGRVIQSSKELGVTSEQTEEFVRRIAVGLKASGTDAQQASDGIRQLTQALASGLLRGDEFNSVMENLPVVAKAIAKGFGATTGELRKMAEAGELDAKRVFDAFIKGSADFDAQAAKSAPTIANSFENIRTQLIQTAGAFDKATEASKSLADFLNNDLVNAIDEVGKILISVKEGPLGDFHRAVSESIDTLLKGAAKLGQVTGLDEIGQALGAKGYVPVDERELSNAARKLIELKGAVDDTEDSLVRLANNTAASEVASAFVVVRDKIQNGYATLEDFNTLIDALRATGTEAGEAYAKMFEKIRDEAVAAGQIVQNELTQKIIDLGKVFATELGTKAPEIIKEMADGFGTVLPLAIGKTVSAMVTAVGQMQELQDINKQLETFGPKLGELSPIGSFGGKMGDAFVTGAAADRVGGTPSAAKTFLRTRAVSSAAGAQALEKLDDEFATRIAKLLMEFPDLVVNEAFRTKAQQAALYAKLKPKGARVAAPGTSRHERGAAVDLSVGQMSPERYSMLKKRAQELGLDAPFGDDRGHFQMAGGAKGGESRLKQETNEMDEWMAKAQQALELKQKDNAIDKDITATVDERAAAKERERLIQEGLLAVEKEYGTVSAENREKVIAMATAMADAGLASDQLKSKQEAAAEQAKKNAAQIQEFNDAMTGIAKTAFSGFVNDLRNGVSAGEAFSNMLDRVVDGLINMAIEAMFAKQAVGGTTSAAGGGLFGWLGKLFGAGMHEGGTVGRDASFIRPVARTAFVGAKRYQRGGVAGFAPGEVPIIAHKGEVIIPKGAQKTAVPTTNSNTTNNVAIRVDSQGNATVTKDQGVGLGKRLNMVVQEEIARQQRAGGLLAGTGPGAR